MDTLNQTKLSLSEWKSIEEPIAPNEKRILQLIQNGYHDVNKKTNNTSTIISITKLEQTSEIDFYLYDKFLKPEIKVMIDKYGKNIKEFENFHMKENTLKKLKSIDLLRIKHVETNITENKTKMFEYLVLDFCREILKSIYKKENNHTFYLYTLIQLRKNNIQHINQYMVIFRDLVINIGKENTNLKNTLLNADEFIERNKYLLEYEDLSLFSHQKDLFSFCNRNKNIPKLLLYTAPTGTGKTLSPIGLSEGYRIIFVCVARHVGLSLAKSAISLEKKVAFAFGCETASDIRLHYFSAVDYTINKRSGGIGKVDNSNGRNVEIMICDAQSYLTAMYYMLSFNDAEQLMTYWDEPTITMDYVEHSLHPILKRNWHENKIPNIVLSCATLPKEEEMAEADADVVEVKPIPQADQKEKVNEMPDVEGQVESGTLKLEEETETAEPIPADTDSEEKPEIEIELGKKIEDMAYIIQELQSKMAKLEEAMLPIDSEVTEEEDLPKLDGAPIEEGLKFSAEMNKKNYGKGVKDAQSNFLSKLYK
jgi:hypothetical protein